MPLVIEKLSFFCWAFKGNARLRGRRLLGGQRLGEWGKPEDGVEIVAGESDKNIDHQMELDDPHADLG